MPPDQAKQHEAFLRELGLGYPGAYEDFPWGERVLKVNKKVFAFLGANESGLHLSVKLPLSNAVALMLPFATPTGYGLGRSGWVSVRFEPHETPPLSLLGQWLDESYRAIAPKKLVAQLPGGAETKRGETAPPKKPAAKKSTAKKAATKTATAKKSAARPGARNA